MEQVGRRESQAGKLRKDSNGTNTPNTNTTGYHCKFDINDDKGSLGHDAAGTSPFLSGGNVPGGGTQDNTLSGAMQTSSSSLHGTQILHSQSLGGAMLSRFNSNASRM